MEKLVRYRKAFYEKENDLQNGNKKRDIPFSQKLKSMSSDKLYQSVSHVMLTKPLQPKDEKPKSNTKIFCQLYSEQLLSPAQYDKRPSQFLKNHNIDGALRARMLDWMIQVISSYKFTHKTFFDGVRLMDSYFQTEKECLPPTRLHIVGVQCMLIASKMEEVYPLKMKTVYEKIGHKKLPMKDLVETEQKIMKCLNYQLNSWTFFDLAMLKMSEFVNKSPQNRQALGQLFSYNTSAHKQHDDKTSEQKILKMQQICSYLSKFILYDYDFYCQNSMLLLAQTVVKATLQIMSITTPINFFMSSSIMIELCKQKLFKLVLGFRNRNIGINNIFKFTAKEVITEVEQFL